jgi:hypothetical protein
LLVARYNEIDPKQVIASRRRAGVTGNPAGGVDVPFVEAIQARHLLAAYCTQRAKLASDCVAIGWKRSQECQQLRLDPTRPHIQGRLGLAGEPEPVDERVDPVVARIESVMD